MLGIIIGVAAVITMVSIGRGADAAVQQQIQSLGNNLLMVVPGATTANGVRSGWGTASTLTVADAAAIRKDCPAVADLTYVKRQIAQVVYGNENWSTSIQGSTPAYVHVRDWPARAGRFFDEQEEAGARPVALLGQTVVDNLFPPGEDPVGATIRVKDVPFEVIGVLAPKGQTSWGQDQDDVVLMPFSTAERRVLGTHPRYGRHDLGLDADPRRHPGRREADHDAAARAPPHPARPGGRLHGPEPERGRRGVEDGE
jgi:ABC-type antimicrobial peptide transport system permease subunit